MKKFLYQLRNWKAHWRAFWLGSIMTAGHISFTSTLGARIIRGDGSALDLGLISRRVVTTAGVNLLRDDFANGAGEISTFKYHDTGTGTNAEAVGDTALQTPTGDARVVGTQDNSVAKQYKSVATVPYTATLAITEHGLFSAAAAGTLWDRSKFAAINVLNGDSIQFTYILTIADGG
jgi:hypothetical protein